MNQQEFETQKEATSSASAKVDYWLQELKLADRRETNWRKEGKGASQIYESEKAKQHSFNILYSNTETLAPALYSTAPRPLAKRRYLDQDAVGQAASKTIQRMLEFQIDTNEGEDASFDDSMSEAVLHALVPGRGVVWWTFEAKIEGEAEADDEKVTPEVVDWTCFRHGYAKAWDKVPWVARERVMTQDELVENFGEVGKEVELCESRVDEDDGSPSGNEQSENKGSIKTATVHEIWDRTTKTVLFISPGLKGRPLKEVDDPYGLQGFFPCVRPLSFIRRTRGLVPICPYSVYREQAEELNRITTRINKIVSALKVRGFYDSQIEGLDLLLEQEDNKLVPADNVAALQQGRKLDDAVWLMPIDKLINVLQQLYVQREQVKQVIYEIMGIADILRGSSAASETATAQNLKSQWGSLRIKKWQRVVAIFARDNLRLVAELSAKHLPIPILQQMTGLPFIMPEEKQQAQMLVQQLQPQLQQIQLMAQQTGQMPPQAQQLQQQLQQAQQKAQSIDWGQIKETLSSDLLRNFRVDIETNSTLDPEATEDKAAISEVLMAISQFFQSTGPLIESGMFPFDAAKQMLLTIVRRFKLGAEVEEQLSGMQAPPPKQDASGEMQKVLDAQKQLEDDTRKAQDALRKEQQKLQDLQRELAFKKREAELEAKYAFREREMEFEAAKKQLLTEVKGLISEHQLQVQGNVQGALQSIQSEGQKQAQAMKAHRDEVRRANGQRQDNSAVLQQLTAVMENLAGVMASPRELIRDPKTGKALRAEVVMKKEQ